MSRGTFRYSISDNTPAPQFDPTPEGAPCATALFHKRPAPPDPRGSGPILLETEMIYALDGIRPEIHETAWIAPTAVLIGRVIVKAGASVWWGAVLRGDNDPIVVGEGSNVQDGSVCHTDPGTPVEIGSDVTIGHMVMLHGCTIGDGSLIGIGAVVLNGARIGRDVVVGAGALVTENKELPDGSLAMGSPAKVVREARPELIERVRQGARNYVRNGERYARGLEPIG